VVQTLLKKALVTGANGFVGQALCNELEKQGIDTVRATRRLQSDEYRAVGDINGSTNWYEALAGCDTVFHLAARVHVMNDTCENPLEAYRSVNTEGTLALARQAAAAGVSQFVFVSSIKVLGEEGHFTENSAPTPIDPYGISKLEAEQALIELGHETGMSVKIIRPPLIYGPGVGANFLQLFNAVKKGIPLPLALANNKRSLVYLGNLVDALIVCAKSGTTGSRIYLIDDGKPVSTAELIMAMASALNVKPILIPLPTWLIKIFAALLGKKQAAQRVLGTLTVDSALIRRDLGWTPPYSLEQGLHTTANWINSPAIKS
jgi:nucleoside-diphosphate-sugar epimerase